MTDYSKWAKIAKQIEDEEDFSELAEEENNTKRESTAVGGSLGLISGGNSLSKEREESTGRLNSFRQQKSSYEELSETLSTLPSKLEHDIMVPIGKKGMTRGKIVRSNEVLAHLGADTYSWTSVQQAKEIIGRKQKNLDSQIEAEESVIRDFDHRLKELDTLKNLRRVHEHEGITEIHEELNDFEDQKESQNSSDFDEEKVRSEYFEIEAEEKTREQQAMDDYDWEEMMARMEKLEASETAKTEAETQSIADEIVRKQPGTESIREEKKQADGDDDNSVREALKSKGNEAFKEKNFEKAVELYTEALQADPWHHILYGNRSAALHRLGRFEEALEDATQSNLIHGRPWAKGLYRQAMAMKALGRLSDAKVALENALKLVPSDVAIRREWLALKNELDAHKQQTINPSMTKHTTKPKRVSWEDGRDPTESFSPDVFPREVSRQTTENEPFTGKIQERAVGEKSQNSISNDEISPQSLPQPKRVSRFKAMRNKNK